MLKHAVTDDGENYKFNRKVSRRDPWLWLAPRNRVGRKKFTGNFFKYPARTNYEAAAKYWKFLVQNLKGFPSRKGAGRGSRGGFDRVGTKGPGPKHRYMGKTKHKLGIGGFVVWHGRPTEEWNSYLQLWGTQIYTRTSFSNSLMKKVIWIRSKTDKSNTKVPFIKTWNLVFEYFTSTAQKYKKVETRLKDAPSLWSRDLRHQFPSTRSVFTPGETASWFLPFLPTVIFNQRP